jgi:thioredoxin reductase (NADPH)
MRIAIIGAGPIGLYFATLCEKNNIDYTIFEASSFAGGQLTRLYPEKFIHNIPSIPEIKATDYITNLLAEIPLHKIVFSKKIDSLDNLKQLFDYIIIATGLGEYQPRKLGVKDEDKYNILYSLTDYAFLAHKKVVIFGGGNSALDWAKQLSYICDVSLVHRRDEFRGDVGTIKDCDLDMYLSYVPEEVTEAVVKIKSVKTNETVVLPYDYILVNFGQIPVKIQFEDLPNVYYIGDSSGNRTLADGLHQAQEVFTKITK